MHKEVGLLLNKLHKQEKITQASLNDLMQEFVAPAYYGGGHLHTRSRITCAFSHM